MKEYKVATRPMGFSSNNKKLEDFLNQHALQGWQMVNMDQSMTTIVFERDKNR